jgi:hypothetical protein
MKDGMEENIDADEASLPVRIWDGTNHFNYLLEDVERGGRRKGTKKQHSKVKSDTLYGEKCKVEREEPVLGRSPGNSTMHADTSSRIYI